MKNNGLPYSHLEWWCSLDLICVLRDFSDQSYLQCPLLTGKVWIRQMLVSAFLMPSVVCGTAFFINFIAIYYHASRAIPFGTMVSWQWSGVAREVIGGIVDFLFGSICGCLCLSAHISLLSFLSAICSCNCWFVSKWNSVERNNPLNEYLVTSWVVGSCELAGVWEKFKVTRINLWCRGCDWW